MKIGYGIIDVTVGRKVLFDRLTSGEEPEFWVKIKLDRFMIGKDDGVSTEFGGKVLEHKEIKE